MAHVLYGAVIGGPDKNDNYFDIRDDWPQTEVALDYNAPLLTIAAASVMTESEDPYFTRLQEGAYASVKPSGMPCDAMYPCKGGSGGLSRAGTIALAVVLSVVGVLIVLALLYLFLVSKRKNAKA
jgi:endoglucanase